MRNNCTSRTNRVFSIASEDELASKAGTNQLTRCSHPSSSHSGSYIAIYITFRASLSGTFLQTLPELVTSLKGRALFISARVMSTDVAHDHGARPAVVKKKKKKRRVPSGFKRFWFYLCWRIRRTSLAKRCVAPSAVGRTPTAKLSRGAALKQRTAGARPRALSSDGIPFSTSCVHTK